MCPPTPPCVYCGAAQAPHILLFLDATLNILIERTLFSIMQPLTKAFGGLASLVVDSILGTLLSLGTFFGLIRYTEDPAHTRSKRTKAIALEAARRGIPMQTMVLNGNVLELSRAYVPTHPGSIKKSWHYFQSIPTPKRKESYSLPTIDDKAVLKSLFTKNHLPIPKGRGVVTEQGALREFHRLKGPVIVKPQEGSRARHTSVNITHEKDLIEAFKRAQELCLFVMVEEYIPGTLYRATCVEGSLKGVIEFIRPSTIADGIHTTEELRVLHNAHKKFPNLTDVRNNAWFIDALRHQGFTLESIPPKGTSLLLSEHSERENGGYFIDVTDTIPKETIEVIEKAARVCQTSVVGFDIISEDIRDKTKRFVFIEANSLPFIEIHSVPYTGTPRHIASSIWDSFELEK